MKRWRSGNWYCIVMIGTCPLARGPFIDLDAAARAVAVYRAREPEANRHMQEMSARILGPFLTRAAATAEIRNPNFERKGIKCVALPPVVVPASGSAAAQGRISARKAEGGRAGGSVKNSGKGFGGVGGIERARAAGRNRWKNRSTTVESG